MGAAAALSGMGKGRAAGPAGDHGPSWLAAQSLGHCQPCQLAGAAGYLRLFSRFFGAWVENEVQEARQQRPGGLDCVFGAFVAQKRMSA